MKLIPLFAQTQWQKKSVIQRFSQAAQNVSIHEKRRDCVQKSWSKENYETSQDLSVLVQTNEAKKIFIFL
jgi:hypothetical protein